MICYLTNNIENYKDKSFIVVNKKFAYFLD